MTLGLLVSRTAEPNFDKSPYEIFLDGGPRRVLSRCGSLGRFAKWVV